MPRWAEVYPLGRGPQSGTLLEVAASERDNNLRSSVLRGQRRRYLDQHGGVIGRRLSAQTARPLYPRRGGPGRDFRGRVDIEDGWMLPGIKKKPTRTSKSNGTSRTRPM